MDDDRVFEKGLPPEWNLLQTGVADGRFAPFEYREIEWIEIPEVYEAEYDPKRHREPIRKKQDIEAVIEALRNCGQLPIERTATGLKIYGYS